jgi:flagellar basal body-associated protein FliL
MRMAAIALAVMALIVGVFWLAAEQRYTGCVQAAEVAHPIVSVSGSDNPFSENYVDTDHETGGRNRAVAQCSRWPL